MLQNKILTKDLKMKTFIKQCQDGEKKVEEYEDFIKFWHESDKTRNMTLFNALGISQIEYETITEHENFIKMLNKKILNI
jgi:hypothetical protein